MIEYVRQVILTGLPGSGKSVVGRELASRLGWMFVDLDAEIVRRSGEPISEIFAEKGEERFRDLEALATAELRGRERLIFAPGGGWITRPATVSILRPPARLVYLRVAPAIAAQRVRSGGSARPLLAGGDLQARISALLESREAAYSTADLTVNAELIVDEVVTCCEGWLVSEGLVP
ncbi:MAG TPA: shikimate kinase [Gemmatimonadaceae bacterium]|nr:shikimate kinase [Gemmatimonadaceae bacterium]